MNWFALPLFACFYCLGFLQGAREGDPVTVILEWGIRLTTLIFFALWIYFAIQGLA